MIGDSDEMPFDFQDNEGAGTKGKKKKGKDEEELKKIMIGFGDERVPNEKTIEVLEEYMIDFLNNLILNSFKRSQRRDPNCNQLLKDDLLYFIQKDKKKYLRCGHIIKAFENYEKIMDKTYQKFLTKPTGNIKTNEYNELSNE